MISLGSATRGLVVSGATDMGKSFKGLYEIIKHKLQSDASSGPVYVFCNSSGNRFDRLMRTAGGLVCATHLEEGRSSWE